MELLHDLSNTTRRRSKRRQSRFLLPETEAEFVRCKAKARELRAQRIATVFVHGRKYLAQAEELCEEARQLLSVRHGNDAEHELARRNAKKRKDEAKKLRKKGRAFVSKARRLTLCFWKFPDQLKVDKDYPPSAYWSCRYQALCWASNAEQQKIVEKGTVLHKTLTPANKKMHWHSERRLLRYQDRIFLATLAKGTQQPHEPWRVDWVTDSSSQMTEEELRCAASQSD